MFGLNICHFSEIESFLEFLVVVTSQGFLVFYWSRRVFCVYVLSKTRE